MTVKEIVWLKELKNLIKHYDREGKNIVVRFRIETECNA